MENTPHPNSPTGGGGYQLTPLGEKYEKETVIMSRSKEVIEKMKGKWTESKIYDKETAVMNRIKEAREKMKGKWTVKKLNKCLKKGKIKEKYYVGVKNTVVMENK